jgi:hypothetical protein
MHLPAIASSLPCSTIRAALHAHLEGERCKARPQPEAWPAPGCAAQLLVLLVHLSQLLLYGHQVAASLSRVSGQRLPAGAQAPASRQAGRQEHSKSAGRYTTCRPAMPPCMGTSSKALSAASATALPTHTSNHHRLRRYRVQLLQPLLSRE